MFYIAVVSAELDPTGIVWRGQSEINKKVLLDDL